MLKLFRSSEAEDWRENRLVFQESYGESHYDEGESEDASLDEELGYSEGDPADFDDVCEDDYQVAEESVDELMSSVADGTSSFTAGFSEEDVAALEADLQLSLNPVANSYRQTMEATQASYEDAMCMVTDEVDAEIYPFLVADGSEVAPTPNPTAPVTEPQALTEAAPQKPRVPALNPETIEGPPAAGEIIDPNNAALQELLESADSSGSSPEQNIRDFQAKYGLSVDGAAGPKTVALLLSLKEAKDLQGDSEVAVDEDVEDEKLPGEPEMRYGEGATDFLEQQGLPGGKFQFLLDLDTRGDSAVRLSMVGIPDGTNYARTRRGNGVPLGEFSADKDLSKFKSMEVNIIDEDTLQIVRRRRENGPGIRSYIQFKKPIELNADNLPTITGEEEARDALDDLSEALRDQNQTSNSPAAQELMRTLDKDGKLRKRLGLDDGVIVTADDAEETPLCVIRVEDSGAVVIHPEGSSEFEALVEQVQAAEDDSDVVRGTPKNTEAESAEEPEGPRLRNKVQNVENPEELTTYLEANYAGMVIGTPTMRQYQPNEDPDNPLVLGAKEEAAIVQFDFMLDGVAFTVKEIRQENTYQKALNEALKAAEAVVVANHQEHQRKSLGGYNQQMAEWQKGRPAEFPEQEHTEFKSTLAENSDDIHAVTGFEIGLEAVGRRGNQHEVTLTLEIKAADESVQKLTATGGPSGKPNQALKQALKKLTREVKNFPNEPPELSAEQRTKGQEQLAVYAEQGEHYNLNLELAGEAAELQSGVDNILGPEDDVTPEKKTEAEEFLAKKTMESIQEAMGVAGTVEFTFFELDGKNVVAHQVKLTNGTIQIHPSHTDFEGKTIQIGPTKKEGGEYRMLNDEASFYVNEQPLESYRGSEMDGREVPEGTLWYHAEQPSKKGSRHGQIGISPSLMYDISESLVQDGKIPGGTGVIRAPGTLTYSVLIQAVPKEEN